MPGLHLNVHKTGKMLQFGRKNSRRAWQEVKGTTSPPLFFCRVIRAEAMDISTRLQQSRVYLQERAKRMNYRAINNLNIRLKKKKNITDVIRSNVVDKIFVGSASRECMIYRNFQVNSNHEPFE